MKGDFSRNSFDPAKHYTAVLSQQGRVALDADWNESEQIRYELVRTALRDVIGPCGAPSDAAGFEIGVRTRKGKSDLTLSPGRMYVEGHLCELDRQTTYSRQPYLPDPVPIEFKAGARYLVYLDVWQRHITYVEDPALLEPALGGVDTTTRTKTIWQVRVVPSKKHGALTARSDAFLSTKGSRYLGSDSRLYRVEIHDGGGPGKATFKWSRENGSVALPIKGYFGRPKNTVVVEKTVAGLFGRFQKRNCVEISDDDAELSGTPRPLARVIEVNESTDTLTFDRSVVFDTKARPKVRKWDNVAEAHGVVLSTGNPLELEDGIRIKFGGTDFKSGDYWNFAARAQTGQVERLRDALPKGIEHHYCALAVIRCLEKGRRPVVEDRRRVFSRAAPSAAAGGAVDPEPSGWVQRIRPGYRWADIVLPRRTVNLLKELASEVENRKRVFVDWGFENKTHRGRGVSALFSGPPGTGKTMAAEILAGHLKRDLFRVDLSLLVSKYIGETEKNLHKIFESAEMSGAVLYFDEADALFGKRTDVQDAHDRLDNIETRYLLQRMEHHEGLAILATNLKSTVDSAFLRRLRLVVEFPLPDHKARLRIWKKVFPERAPVGKVDFTRLAKLEVSGESIRNIALRAALLAAARRRPISMGDIESAAERERGLSS